MYKMARKTNTMTDNRVSCTLDSTLDSVDQAEETARRVAAEAHFSKEEIYEISMSVREAVINAVIHGNIYDPAKKVHVVFERQPEALRITVTDQGQGFNPDQVPNPLDPENLLKQSGRGLFLIRSYMDEVRVQKLKSGLQVHMIKRIRGNPAKGKESAKS
jgi:serine/threonine-protein kinase RsbW